MSWAPAATPLSFYAPICAALPWQRGWSLNCVCRSMIRLGHAVEVPDRRQRGNGRPPENGASFFSYRLPNRSPPSAPFIAAFAAGVNVFGISKVEEEVSSGVARSGSSKMSRQDADGAVAEETARDGENNED